MKSVVSNLKIVVGTALCVAFCLLTSSCNTKDPGGGVAGGEPVRGANGSIRIRSLVELCKIGIDKNYPLKKELMPC